MTEAVIKELEAKHDAAYAKWRRRINEWEEECGDPGLIANALEDLIDAKVALELARERARVDAEMESERNRMRTEIERINRTLSSMLIHSLPKN